MRRQRSLPSAIVLTVALTGVGCAAATGVRPVTGDDAAPGSVEYDRRQLQGTWRLDTYTVYEGPTHRRVPATAQLTCDESGNLSITGTIKDTEGADAAHRLLIDVSGRAVIDAKRKELRLIALDAAADQPLDAQRRVDFNETRRYAVKPTALRLTVVGETGNTLATTEWTKLR